MAWTKAARDAAALTRKRHASHHIGQKAVKKAISESRAGMYKATNKAEAERHEMRFEAAIDKLRPMKYRQRGK